SYRRLPTTGKGSSGNAHGQIREIACIHAPMPAASRKLGIAVMDCLVQDQLLRDALELEGTDLDETEPTRRDVRQGVLPDEDLSRPGLRRDARRDVHCPAEVVTLVVDHWACVHADVRWRQPGWFDALHDLE